MEILGLEWNYKYSHAAFIEVDRLKINTSWAKGSKEHTVPLFMVNDDILTFIIASPKLFHS